MLTIINITISTLIVIAFTYIYPKADAEIYGGKFLDLISKNKSAGKFWNWLFTRWEIKTHKIKAPDDWEVKIFHPIVPYYRVFHFLIAIVYWSLAYIFFYSNFPLYVFMVIMAGVIIAWWLMTFDRLFYTMRDEVKLLILWQLEKKKDIYWLKRPWFIGAIIFKKEFVLWKFDICMYIGLLILVLVNLIFLGV